MVSVGIFQYLGRFIDKSENNEHNSTQIWIIQGIYGEALVVLWGRGKMYEQLACYTTW